MQAQAVQYRTPQYRTKTLNDSPITNTVQKELLRELPYEVKLYRPKIDSDSEEDSKDDYSDRIKKIMDFDNQQEDTPVYPAIHRKEIVLQMRKQRKLEKRRN